MPSAPPRWNERNEDVLQIHDPGLTPSGREQARLFPALYEYHIKPTLIVTSPLRRCLQTTSLAFGAMIRSGEVRAVAHPGLQEVSTDPCDTGTPLDALREEFPHIQFPDELFPRNAWPRERSVQLRKNSTIYDDVPELLLARLVDFRKWLREEVDDEEVVVVTHGGFVHFFYDRWDGIPGRSGSRGYDLGNGEAVPIVVPGPKLPDGTFKRGLLGIGPSPFYKGMTTESRSDVGRLKRDCGIFTCAHLQ